MIGAGVWMNILQLIPIINNLITVCDDRSRSDVHVAQCARIIAPFLKELVQHIEQEQDIIAAQILNTGCNIQYVNSKSEPSR